MLKDQEDVFGHEIYDYYHGQGGYEIIERDDGFFITSLGPRLYFMEIQDWPEPEGRAMEYARGKVLDIGCGAGRHSLYLQGQGLDVLGIDNSPRAIEVCQARGLRQTQLLSLDEISTGLGCFDTLLMLGNNFSLLGSEKRAKRLLRRFHKLTSLQGRILAGTRNPYETQIAEHLEYHESNRRKGKPGGRARIKVRYKKFASPWINFLMVSQDEMINLLAGTGWHASKFLDGSEGIYVAVIDKD